MELPDDLSIDPVVFYLADGDIEKMEAIESTEFETVMEWYYMVRVRKLNEMLYDIDHLKQMQKD